MQFSNYTLSSFVTTILPVQDGEAPRVDISPADYSQCHNLRKRKEIDYCETDNAKDDDDDDYLVPVKKRKISNKPLPPKKIFPFLSLPPEIRNRIYELTVGQARDEEWLVAKTRNYRRVVRMANAEERERNFSDNGRYYRSNRRCWAYSMGNEAEEEDEPEELVTRAPHVLAVCRQIFEEAGPILYPKTFVIEDTTALHHFLSDIGPCKRKFVKQIVIRGYGQTKSHKAYNYPALSLLKDLPGIEEVVFDCTINYVGWRQPERGMLSNARQIFRDGFRWLEAVDEAVKKIKLGDAAFHNEDREKVEPVFYKELRRLLRVDAMWVPT